MTKGLPGHSEARVGVHIARNAEVLQDVLPLRSSGRVPRFCLDRQRKPWHRIGPVRRVDMCVDTAIVVHAWQCFLSVALAMHPEVLAAHGTTGTLLILGSVAVHAHACFTKRFFRQAYVVFVETTQQAVGRTTCRGSDPCVLEIWIAWEGTSIGRGLCAVGSSPTSSAQMLL